MSLAIFLAGILVGGAITAVLRARSGEQFAEQMKAISVRHAAAGLRAGREARGGAAGSGSRDRRRELGKRTEEIKRSLDPIAQHLKRVSDEVDAARAATGGRRTGRCGRCSSR